MLDETSEAVVKWRIFAVATFDHVDVSVFTELVQLVNLFDLGHVRLLEQEFADEVFVLEAAVV